MKLALKLLLHVLLIPVFSCQHSEKNSQNEKLSFTRENSEAVEAKSVQRYGMVIGLKPEKINEYKELHANAWPGVLEQITESNIQNYSIFLHQIEGKYYLFSYFEYVGDNYQRDMEKMAADSVTQAWWKLTDSYQIPLDSRKEGTWWAKMEEFFHYD